MFVIQLHYIKPLEQVDLHVGAHRVWLERHYASGHFLLSGRKQPRTGGVILALAKERADIDAILAQDPFALAGVAEYAVTEFIPAMAAERLAWLAA
jgi:uncharacterized protein YciI